MTATPHPAAARTPARHTRRKRRRQSLLISLPPQAFWREAVVVVGVYLLAIIALLWPYSIQAASAIPGRRDVLLQIWIGRWVQHALLTAPNHLFDGNAFYPLEHSLAFSDANVPIALLMAPVQLLTGNAILAYNVAIFATFLIAATGMYALIRYWTGNRAVALLAGLAFAFLPYRYAHLWHLNQLGHAWTPWVVLLLFLLARSPHWLLAVVLGLLVAVEAVSSFYLAFQLALILPIMVAVVLLIVAQTRSWQFVRQLTLAAVVALAVIVPLALPYLDVREGQGLERTLDEAEQWQAAPRSYLKVASQNRVWLWLNAEHNGEDTLFPGGVALLGAVAALVFWKRRKVLVTALLLLGTCAVVLALGPTWTRADGTEIALPYRFLFENFALFRAMRVAARFGVVLDFVVVALAGLGLAELWGWLVQRWAMAQRRAVAPLLTMLLALLIAGELASVPIPLRQPDQTPAVAAPYRWLAEQPGQGAVMEFPATPGPWATGLMMFWSTTYWKPLVQGTSGFTPQPHSAVINSFVAPLVRPDGQRGAALSHPTPDNVGLLQDLGVRYVVVQRGGYEPADWSAVQARARAAFGAGPAFANDLTEIYLVPPGAVAAPQAQVSAPATAQVGGDWQPVLTVNNPLPRWAVNYVKAPVVLTLRWHDGQGRVVRQETVTLPVAVVGPPGTLRCTLAGCGLGEQKRQPVQVGLPAPGRYTVDLTVRGGLSASATTVVEVQPAP